jgi:hypothetical protein
MLRCLVTIAHLTTQKALKELNNPVETAIRCLPEFSPTIQALINRELPVDETLLGFSQTIQALINRELPVNKMPLGFCEDPEGVSQAVEMTVNDDVLLRQALQNGVVALKVLLLILSDGHRRLVEPSQQTSAIR